MNKKLKWIIIALVALIVVLIILKKAGVLGKDEGIKVTAEKAAKRTIVETVNASGKIFPEVEVKLSPDISGEIIELDVEEGDSVKKGQVLAKIYAKIPQADRVVKTGGWRIKELTGVELFGKNLGVVGCLLKCVEVV